MFATGYLKTWATLFFLVLLMVVATACGGDSTARPEETEKEPQPSVTIATREADLALSEFIAILGLTMEDLSSQEASCLREWVADTDPAIVADTNPSPAPRACLSP